MRCTILCIISAFCVKQALSACLGENQTTTVDAFRYTRVDRPADATDAANLCSGTYSAEGLAIIRTNTTSDAIITIIRGCNDYFFFGLQQVGTTWIWRDFQTLADEDARWQSGEGAGTDPNKKCAVIFSGDGMWAEQNCGVNKPYVCEKNLLIVSVIDVKYALVNETVTWDVEIKSADGAVNMSVYRNNDRTNVISISFNVYDPFKYEIASVNTDDNGTYTFVASRDVYSRSTSGELVVQDPAFIVNDLPQQAWSPVTRGPPDLACPGRGTPSPLTSWNKNNISITQDPNAPGVYQTITGSTAVLHIDNAISSDDGKYVCATINRIGEDNVAKIATDQTVLRVFGSPTIHQVVTTSCNKTGMTVMLSWIPNNQTIEINHVIKFTSPTQGADASYNITAYSHSIINTIIGGLSASQTYNIKITVCPDDCIDKLNDSTTFAADVPANVVNVSVSEINDISSKQTICAVRWDWNEEIYPNDMVTFMIMQSSLVAKSHNCNGEEANVTYVSVSDATLYQVVTLPNHKYSFSVYATNCAGDSAETLAEGQCLSEYVSAPPQSSAVKSDESQSDSETTRTINIEIPEERYGSISCLFVIVKQGGGSVSPVESLDALRNLSLKSSSSPVDREEYIAVAIPMSSVYSETTHSVLLGDATESTCDVQRIPDCPSFETGKLSSDSLKGRNWELDNGLSYSVFVVSSTPSSQTDAVIVDQGDYATFEHQFGEEEGTTWWIILLAVIGGILFVLAFVLVLRYVHLKKQRAKDYKATTTEMSTNISGASLSSAQQQGHVYEEVSPASVYDNVLRSDN